MNDLESCRDERATSRVEPERRRDEPRTCRVGLERCRDELKTYRVELPHATNRLDRTTEVSERIGTGHGARCVRKSRRCAEVTALAGEGGRWMSDPTLHDAREGVTGSRGSFPHARPIVLGRNASRRDEDASCSCSQECLLTSHRSALAAEPSAPNARGRWEER